MDYIRVTRENIDKEHICCAMSGKQSLAKKEWLKQRFEEGLVFYRSAERGKCFIEYIPAENAWVPIDAAGWLYINCLSSLHVDEEPGDRASDCGGIMEPVAVWVRKGGEWAIIHRCRLCGKLTSNRIAADDNPMLLMSIAMRPLCTPPFPLERIEEMTALMGREGRMR